MFWVVFHPNSLSFEHLIFSTSRARHRSIQASFFEKNSGTNLVGWLVGCQKTTFPETGRLGCWGNFSKAPSFVFSMLRRRWGDSPKYLKKRCLWTIFNFIRINICNMSQIRVALVVFQEYTLYRSMRPEISYTMIQFLSPFFFYLKILQLYNVVIGGLGFYCWWKKIPNNHLGCIKPCKYIMR